MRMMISGMRGSVAHGDREPCMLRSLFPLSARSLVAGTRVEVEAGHRVLYSRRRLGTRDRVNNAALISHPKGTP